MPRPVARKSGVYHLNVRVPADLAERLAGASIGLPLGDQTVSVKARDKIMMSPRTKDMTLA